MNELNSLELEGVAAGKGGQQQQQQSSSGGNVVIQQPALAVRKQVRQRAAVKVAIRGRRGH